MKAFLNRFHRGGTKDKDLSSKHSPSNKEKSLQLPPLPEWPPPSQRVTSTPASITSFKPLPEINTRFLLPVDEPPPSFSTHSTSSSTPTPPRLLPPPLPLDSTDVEIPSRTSTTTRNDQNLTDRVSRKTTNGSVDTTTGISDVQKKVAFISPPPTPMPSTLDRILPDPFPNGATPPGQGPPIKTTLSRFQATHGKEPRGSTTTAASSTNDLPSSSKVSVKATSTRNVVSPSKGYEDGLSINQSLRSGTPYSQMSNNKSHILAAASWSETAEDDLVSNLGSRERTRQEVLFEILASEERYVAELFKMKDTFIDPLLHPFAASPIASPRLVEYDDLSRAESPMDSSEYLPPIAARFMSPSPFRSDTPASPAIESEAVSTRKSDKDKDTPNIDGESLETDEEDEGDDRLGKGYPSYHKGQAAKHNHPRSPYRATTTRTPARSNAPVPFPSRSHQSLPAPPRTNQMSASTHSLGRQSVVGERERNLSQGQTSSPDRKATSTPGSRMMRKFKKSQTAQDSIFGGGIAPHQLPDDLRICLEVVDSGVLDGHKKLSEALRKRYEEQYPLVRSLADVFVSNSDIFHGYATYVLHLERALEQVDAALSNVAKKPKKQDVTEWAKVCQFLQELERDACEKGETGLAITLSKPFQRLLKYPLLFQNLLFHTDPSTFEYESTLQMVAEVETIVRSIEDEKIQKEERDKTRDVFARIEGLDKVRQLALPKPSRVLIEERLYVPGTMGLLKPSSPPPVINPKAVKGKSSFKRLSDVLHSSNGLGGKKDLWLVVFNDVVLQCQRTGTTCLPLVAATSSRTNSLPELQGKAKYATTGRRNAQTRPRNLYKFIKIETWAIGDVVQPREGVVSMEDVVRSRAQVHTNQPKIVPLPDDDEDEGGESDDSDRKSKMSFSYWGADKITVQKPLVKPRIGNQNGARRGPQGIPSSYGRESSANAKFGSRLVSGDSPPTGPRAASRRAQPAQTVRKASHSDETQSAKATVTRPAWDTSTRSQFAAAPIPKRTRNISQTSAATRVATTAKALSSPAPSEDSGVGLYRQMLAQDPSLNGI